MPWMSNDFFAGRPSVHPSAWNKIWSETQPNHHLKRDYQDNLSPWHLQRYLLSAPAPFTTLANSHYHSSLTMPYEADQLLCEPTVHSSGPMPLHSHRLAVQQSSTSDANNTVAHKAPAQRRSKAHSALPRSTQCLILPGWPEVGQPRSKTLGILGEDVPLWLWKVVKDLHSIRGLTSDATIRHGCEALLSRITAL
ncbi:hypothetical protein BAUCODRAFT_445004 [Baudoinia panamericana UAMH 10762]|uniref:Uncharacterized protein n=1 Tax=Baudoinia panamericana (strain UAMH 10762) TaxID=717646 RepID=M2NE71_BAUPA|nr:uncharacterized protein BAUCODRAFT_445004 [Baudoinia panamericana UAMH 10762]EMC97250.1 hypothetical protein BAUCODRAFT_445004 [Baudoinia panamericana UAMH 10762]